MSTINISLPPQQAKQIDDMVSKYGFANRSEFIRSLIRLVVHKKEVLTESIAFPFVTPKERSKKVIVKSFSQTNKYSKDFLKDLETGLANSDYFTD